MAWALCFVGKPQYAALAPVIGGAGLRIGECCELRRRDCVDGPKGGMWSSVRGTLATPGRTWTYSGDGIERRGTKAKGPDGDLRGRRTFLQPAEATVLRTHLEQFSARPSDARVFTSTTGRHLGSAGTSRAFLTTTNGPPGGSPTPSLCGLIFEACPA